MSGICGIINFDGAPVDPALLQKMAQAAAYRGPDGINYWIQGNVGFAHLALHTTPESLRERQPLTNLHNSATLAADARVDNRDELIRTLTAKGYLQGNDPTDADLILAAYECWGEDCPKYIIGDFAFAIWDAQQQRLFCARDTFGMRPLHYCQMGQSLLFASSVGAIVAALAQLPPINYTLLQDMLAGEFGRWIHETAYQTIFRVPQSYYLVATANKVSLTRYWIWGAQPGVHYKNEAEYIDHFRALFQDVVRACMRCTSPVSILVSGGLDSSSIACTAEHLVTLGDASIQGRLYSNVFEHSPRADEREYLEAVLEKCPHLKPTLVPGDDGWLLQECAEDSSFPLDEPDLLLDRARIYKMLRLAREDGCRVNLWGLWGNQVLHSGAYNNPGAIMDISLTRLPAEWQFFYRRSGWRLLAEIILHYLNIGTGLGKKLSEWQQKSISREMWFMPLFQPSDVACPDVMPPPRLKTASAQNIYYQSTWGQNTVITMALEKAVAYGGMELRLPFVDRRLLDYILNLPPVLLFRNGLTRYILREAMAGILPEQVRQRIRGAPQTELTERGLRDKEVNRIQALLEDARVARAGYVKAERLAAAWEFYWQKADLRLLRPLTWGLCVEVWLRHQEVLAAKVQN